MTQPITHAMILAAGFGTRLRPLTDTVPKAMVTVSGKPLLGYAIDRLLTVGVEKIVINTHYLPQVIADYITARHDARLRVIHEPVILETGGGIKNALPQLGDAPFFVINADSLWAEAGAPLLAQLATAHQPHHKATLALIPNTGDYPELSGDFAMDATGRLTRAGLPRPLPWHYIGAQILHPSLFTGAPDGAFSLNVLYDHAAARGCLFGHHATAITWYHISTPADYTAANSRFSE